MDTDLRPSGIEGLGDMAWGTHFCLFYETKNDLLDFFIPFFKAGLEHHEFCLCVASQPLIAEEAERAMRQAIPNFERYLAEGQFEITPHTDWYLKEGHFDEQRVLQGWIDKLNQALSKGFSGVRFAANILLEQGEWESFSRYEGELEETLRDVQIEGLCAYNLNRYSAANVLDVIHHHQFTLARRDGAWEALEGVGLKRAHEEVLRLNAELEQRVIERTAELTSINEQLRAEIGERKRAEEALGESEEKFAAAFRASPISLVIATLDGKYVEMNQAFCELLGYSREELLGKTAVDIGIFNAETRREWLEAIERAGGVMTNVEFNFRLRNGISRTTLFSVETIAFHGVPHRLTTVLDITERKRMEEALRISENNFRTLADKSLEGIQLYQGGRSVYANAAMTALMGYTQEELKAMSMEEHIALVHPLDRAIAVERARKRQAGEEVPASLEVRLLTKAGATRWVQGFTNEIEYNGQPAILSTAIDITERKQTEAELRTQKEILQKIFDHTPMMIGMISMDGQWQMINRAWERTMGWTLEELQQSNFDVLAEVYPDPGEHQKVMDFIAAKSGQWEEFKARSRNGRVLDVTFTNVYLSDGTTLGFGLDITERKQAETTIRSLLQISEKLTATLDIDVLLDALVIEAIKLIDAEIGWSGLRTEEGMVCHTHIGRDLQVIPFQYLWPPGVGLPGWVLAHKVPYVMNDAQLDKLIIPEIRERFGVKAAIDTPILDAQGEVIGFFEVNNKKNGARFSESDVEKLVAVSRIASSALQNAISYGNLQRAEEEMNRQAARAETLARIAARLNKQLDLEAVIHAVCDEAVNTFKVSQATMSLYNKKSDLLVYAGGVNIPPEYAASMEPITRSQFEDFLQAMGPIIVIPDIQSLPDVPNAEFSSHLDVRTVVTAAMLRDQELVGVLVVGVNGHVREFDQDELTLLKAISDQAAQAIANALLLRAANEQHEQLRALSTKLVDVQETERRALTTELHDRVGQNLTGLSINLQNMKALLSNESAKALTTKFDDAQVLVQDTTRQIRDIMAELHPPELEDYGLAVALETYAERAASRGNLELIANLPDLAPPPLPSNVRIALFRAAQEAISNALKHANATQLEVSLEGRDGQIRLRVEDDGQGFEPDSVSQNEAQSWGLKIMRERIESIGGEVQVNSEPGHGTRVIFEIERPS